MKTRQAIIIHAILAAVTAAQALAHDDAPAAGGLPPEQLGKVHFPTSCDAGVQPAFERGVALLHSFWFPEARKVFLQVLEHDPSCAIAYGAWASTACSTPLAGSRPKSAARRAGRCGQGPRHPRQDDARARVCGGDRRPVHPRPRPLERARAALRAGDGARRRGATRTTPRPRFSMRLRSTWQPTRTTRLTPSSSRRRRSSSRCSPGSPTIPASRTT